MESEKRKLIKTKHCWALWPQAACPVWPPVAAVSSIPSGGLPCLHWPQHSHLLFLWLYLPVLLCPAQIDHLLISSTESALSAPPVFYRSWATLRNQTVCKWTLSPFPNFKFLSARITGLSASLFLFLSLCQGSAYILFYKYRMNRLMNEANPLQPNCVGEWWTSIGREKFFRILYPQASTWRILFSVYI